MSFSSCSKSILGKAFPLLPPDGLLLTYSIFSMSFRGNPTLPTLGFWGPSALDGSSSTHIFCLLWLFAPYPALIHQLCSVSGSLSGSPEPLFQVIHSKESHKLTFHITFNTIEIFKCLAHEWHFLLISSTVASILGLYSVTISMANGIGGELNIYTHGFLFPLKNLFLDFMKFCFQL